MWRTRKSSNKWRKALVQKECLQNAKSGLKCSDKLPVLCPCLQTPAQWLYFKYKICLQTLDEMFSTLGTVSSPDISIWKISVPFLAVQFSKFYGSCHNYVFWVAHHKIRLMDWTEITRVKILLLHIVDLGLILNICSPAHSQV